MAVILADTSIWITFFQSAKPVYFTELLESGAVCMHPFVEGELILGGIPDRYHHLLGALTGLLVTEHELVCDLIQSHRLKHSGIGWVDAHLLTATLLAGVHILTNDAALARVAKRLRCLHIGP